MSPLPKEFDFSKIFAQLENLGIKHAAGANIDFAQLASIVRALGVEKFVEYLQVASEAVFKLVADARKALADVTSKNKIKAAAGGYALLKALMEAHKIYETFTPEGVKQYLSTTKRKNPLPKASDGSSTAELDVIVSRFVQGSAKVTKNGYEDAVALLVERYETDDGSDAKDKAMVIDALGVAYRKRRSLRPSLRQRLEEILRKEDKIGWFGIRGGDEAGAALAGGARPASPAGGARRSAPRRSSRAKKRTSRAKKKRASGTKKAPRRSRRSGGARRPATGRAATR